MHAAVPLRVCLRLLQQWDKVRSNIMKTFAITVSCAFILSAGTALAAQNVANTSQKGSLLIWPEINIDPVNGTDTFVEISNDGLSSVHVECYYVNGRKGRVDFDFDLSPKKTGSWAVGSLAGDQVSPPAFPTNGTFQFGDIFHGMLACFATDIGATQQIAFNHLTGTATVANSATAAPARQPKEGFRYNAWSFIARGDNGPEQDGVPQGPAGSLALTGDGAGTYDACPAYNIANFMPNGARLGGLTTLNNTLTVVSCNQDLRQDYLLHLTKLQFTVWNSQEHSFTGAYQCVDSNATVVLGAQNTSLINGSNFDFRVLRTRNARFAVQGVPSARCNFMGKTQTAGLLGVLASGVSIPSGDQDQIVGSTTMGAGAVSGFVYWDPRSVAPPKGHRK